MKDTILIQINEIIHAMRLLDEINMSNSESFHNLENKLKELTKEL